MNSEKLQLQIISPAGFLFDGDCHLVTLPGENGELGIMPNHEAIVVALQEGKVIIFSDKEEVLKEFEITSGFAEMLENKLLVLVD